MKNLAILSIFAVMIGSVSFTSHGAETASTTIPEAKYPKVDSEKRAHFQIHAPEANDLKIDICGRKYDMTRDSAGNWSVITDPLVVGFHYYFTVVDGLSVIDPRAKHSMDADAWPEESRFQKTKPLLHTILSTAILPTDKFANAGITPT